MTVKITSRWKDRIAQPERRIDAERLGAYVSKRAAADRKWRIELDAGGGDINTETAVAVSDPDGLTVVWIGRTRGDAEDRVRAESALPGSAAVLGLVNRRDARVVLGRAGQGLDALDPWDYIKAEHAKHWSPIEKLAAQAE